MKKLAPIFLEGAAVAVGLTLILALTLFAFGFDVAASLGSIAKGALGDKFGLGRTLARSTPLIICGAGLAIAWRARMFNIGGEGQYIAGGLAAAAVYKVMGSMPALVFQSSAMAASAVGGAALAAFAGWLQVKRGVQTVISTILMNFVMIQFLTWIIDGPLQESKGQIPQTDRIPKALALWRPDSQTDFHSGFVVAVALAVLAAWWLFFTKGGFILRLCGENARAAKAAGYAVEKVQVGAMAASGAFFGLAGAVTYLGLSRQVGLGFSEGWGFLAIPVALLGGLNPGGAVLSGLYFGGLLAGSESLARSQSTGNTAVFVIQGVAVLAFVTLRQTMESRRAQRRSAD